VTRVIYKLRFLPLVMVAVLAAVSPMAAQAAGGLGSAAGFAVIAGAAVTCTGPNSNVTGPVGLATSTTAVTKTGCTMHTQVNAGAYAAFLNAFKSPPGPCATTVTADPGLTGANSLPTGVSCFAAALTMTTGTLTLTGSGPWNIEVGTGGTGALTATNTTVVSSNPCNVFWWVKQGVTLTGTAGQPPTAFQGTILAGADITLTDTSLTGRAWAGGAGTAALPTGAVTLTRSPVLGCTAAGTVPGQGCKEGKGGDTDESADKSGDSESATGAGHEASDSSGNENKDKQDKADGDHGKGCDSGDSSQNKESGDSNQKQGTSD
jgi:hypothetical protein